MTRNYYNKMHSIAPPQPPAPPPKPLLPPPEPVPIFDTLVEALQSLKASMAQIRKSAPIKRLTPTCDR